MAYANCVNCCEPLAEPSVEEVITGIVKCPNCGLDQDSKKTKGDLLREIDTAMREQKADISRLELRVEHLLQQIEDVASANTED